MKRYFYLAAVLTALFPTLCLADSGYDNWVQGKESLRGGHPKKALKLLEHAVRKEPEDPVYRNWLGSVYYDLQRFSDAAEQLKHAAKLDANSAWYYYLAKSNLEIAWQTKDIPDTEASRRAALAAAEKTIEFARKIEWTAEIRKAMPLTRDLTKRKASINRLREKRQFARAIIELDDIIALYPFKGIAKERRLLSLALEEHKSRQELRNLFVAIGAVIVLVAALLAWRLGQRRGRYAAPKPLLP